MDLSLRLLAAAAIAICLQAEAFAGHDNIAVDPALKRYSSSKYVSSFCGFAPAENPEIVCYVMLDEPKKDYWGGSVAAQGSIDAQAGGIFRLGNYPASAQVVRRRLAHPRYLGYAPEHR